MVYYESKMAGGGVSSSGLECGGREILQTTAFATLAKVLLTGAAQVDARDNSFVITTPYGPGVRLPQDPYPP